MLACLDEAGNGGDVDDGARVAVLVLACFLQKREESGGHEEELGNVGPVRVGPVVEGGVFVVEEVLGHFFGGLGFGLLGCAVYAGIID